MWKRIVIGLLILLAFIIQTSVFRFLSIGGVVPNLLLILTVSFGFMRGKRSGMLIGFFCGALVDLVYGDVPGVYAMSYLVIGFIIGFLYKVYYDQGIRVPLLIVGISDIIYHFLLMGLLKLTGHPVHVLLNLKNVVMPEMVYTLLVSIVMYRLLYVLNKRFIESEVEGQELPWLKR